jgi:ferredoxin--NADP+ reductase
MKYKLKIVEIKEETDKTKTYFLEKPEELNWDEGSHTHIAHNGYDDGEFPNKNLVRHMSIMTLNNESRLGFTTRLNEKPSEFKRKLKELTIGDDLIVFKLGSRMKLRRENRSIVLLSMGVGIATMRPLIKSYLEDNTGISKLTNINVDAIQPHIYQSELNTHESRNYINHWTKSRVEFYQTLSQIINDKHSIFYIVGSDVFLRTVIKKLKAFDVKREDIMIDKKDGILQLYYEF